MPMLNQDEKANLIHLAKAGDLPSQVWVDHEAALANIRAGKEGDFIVARFATTAPIVLATTGLTVIDGVTPVAGNIALVKDQGSSIQNGLYLVSAGAWTRVKDSTDGDILKSGMVVSVSEGTAAADTLWTLTTNAGFVVGTNNINFAQYVATGVSALTLAAGGGAATIGSVPAGGIAAANVQAALNELDGDKVSSVALALVTTPGGASYVGVFDTLNLITATNVESALAELVKYVPVALADPGTGVAIPVTRSASVAITTAAAETNSLAIPSFIGQKLLLYCNVYAVGDRVVTATAAIDASGKTIMTFGAAGDFIALEAIRVGGTLRWQVTANDGVALS